MNDSYGQSERMGPVEEPTAAAELIIYTFPVVLDGGRVNTPGGAPAGPP